MRIAKEYGERLENNNLKEQALYDLLAAYPSHGFVIDRNEARKIFKSVEAPSKELREIGDFLDYIVTDFINKDDTPFVCFLNSELKSDKITETSNSKNVETGAGE